MNLLLINALEAMPFLQLIAMLFLGILFTQSGLDKVFNYKSNRDWLKGHFEKTPLKNMVGVILPFITLLETAAGVLSLMGIIVFLINGSTQLGLIGAQLSALSIIALFFGQRLAQDYAGAATLATYFLVCLIAIYILG